MRTRSVVILGASLALAGVGTPAVAADQGAAMAASLPLMGKGYSGVRPPRGDVRPGTSWGRPGTGGTTTVHRWGPRYHGRWHAGWNAPGGWNGYRRPVYGYVLPRYWVSPRYYIGNYSAYGLSAPPYGYGWSRYYDDAVMTDRYGRIYDHRSDVEWDRHDGGYEDYHDDRGQRRADSGLGGAAIGAVAGGIAGNVIAGRGNRTAGTLIGAGVGAVAGYAIDKAEDGRPGPRRAPGPGAAYDQGYGYADDGVTTDNDYQGRWVGTWRGQDGSTYSGEYEGRYQGQSRGSYGVDYDAPPEGVRPHWNTAPAQAPVTAPPVTQGGYVAGGYYYPAPTVTTVTVQPATTTTTTTTYVTEQVRYRKAAARKPAARKVIAGKKPCNC
ncbi:MAG: RcnB family protein [Sphingobium sp.]